MTPEESVRAANLFNLCYLMCAGVKPRELDKHELQLNEEHYALLNKFERSRFINIPEEQGTLRFFCGVPVRKVDNIRTPRLMKEAEG